MPIHSYKITRSSTQPIIHQKKFLPVLRRTSSSNEIKQKIKKVEQVPLNLPPSAQPPLQHIASLSELNVLHTDRDIHDSDNSFVAIRLDKTHIAAINQITPGIAQIITHSSVQLKKEYVNITKIKHSIATKIIKL